MKRDIRRELRNMAIACLRWFGLVINVNTEQSSIRSTNNDIPRNDEL
jgi:RNA polymerase subunit RPABC4/transcription elongation factor Spt4